MNIKAYQLSSFTNHVQGGNPAGVVLDADGLDENQMQLLAGKIGFSETAYVSKTEEADFQVRFFTPCAEVDLCGHATIATFSLLKQLRKVQDGEYIQKTKAGLLKIIIQGNTVLMQQTSPEFYEILDQEELFRSLGIGKEDFDDRFPIQAVSTGIKDILVPVKNKAVLKNLKPDMQEIEMLSKKYDACGLHVFAVEEGSEVIAACRNFAPLYGIPEESATGTSNGALASYLYQYGFAAGVGELIFEQGMYMEKPSIIKARLVVDKKGLAEIWVGGEAVLLGETQYEIE